MAITALSMRTKIKTFMAAVGASQSADPAASQTQRDAMLLAMCQGIVDEIVANSELVALTRDSGAAGAGIITGKVM